MVRLVMSSDNCVVSLQEICLLSIFGINTFVHAKELIVVLVSVACGCDVSGFCGICGVSCVLGVPSVCGILPRSRHKKPETPRILGTPRTPMSPKIPQVPETPEMPQVPETHHRHKRHFNKHTCAYK